MSRAHPTAVIDPAAEIADDVEIGPYCVVGAGVTIGAGSVLGPHVIIGGRTTIGRNNHFFPFCAIGGVPQDKKYAGEDTELVIGDGNTVRESCTISIGTARRRRGDQRRIRQLDHGVSAHRARLQSSAITRSSPTTPRLPGT